MSSGTGAVSAAGAAAHLIDPADTLTYDVIASGQLIGVQRQQRC
jgi:hypothetical protein